MKKIILWGGSIIIATLCVFVVLVKNNKPSTKGMKNNFQEAMKMADSLQKINPFNGREFCEWELSTVDEIIMYKQLKDVSFYDEFEILNFKLSPDSSFILVEEYLFANHSDDLGGGNTLTTFGPAHLKFRVFRNAENFKDKFNKFLKDRSILGSFKDLELSDYFPAISWENLKLRRHDGEYKYKYAPPVK
jgi:hypothetical protein